MTYNCIIVDDEPNAQQILAHYAAQLDYLKVVSICKNAFEALSIIQKEAIDLIFLDIQMPQFNGLEFVRSLNQKPKIIFSTAFTEYAVDGFELGVTDYLLKPFSFERFVKAVSRALEVDTKDNGVIEEKNVESQIDFVFLKIDANTLEKVMLQEINYIEAYGNYVKVFTKNKMHLVPETMIGMEKLLPNSLFARIHKSYIIPITKVKAFTNDTVQINEEKLPLGKIYRLQFLERMKS
jgi:two-component system, LytTR family, response regulator